MGGDRGVWGWRGGDGVAVGALEVVPGRVGWAVPSESVGIGVAGPAGDGDVPLAEVGGGIAGCPKELAVSWKSRIEDRNVGISGDGGHEPALVGVEAGNNGAASRRARARRGVVVGELYAFFPEVVVQVGHELLEVALYVIGAFGKDGWPSQLIDEDEEDVGLRARFGCVLSEAQAAGYTCAGDGGGGFRGISAFHCVSSNR